MKQRILCHNHRFWAVVLALCLVLGSVSVMTAIAANNNNLITNGDFNSYIADTNTFSNWNFWNGNQSVNTMHRAQGRLDTNAMLITNGNDIAIPTVSTQFPVEAGKSYRVVAYIKTAASDEVSWNCPSWSATNGIYLRVDSLNNSMTELKSEIIKHPNRWQRITFVVNDADIPNQLTSLRLSLVMKYTRGLVYLDDVTVTEYTGEELEPEVLDDLYNTDFELVSGTQIDDWSKTIPNNKVTITPTNASQDVYSGNYAVKISSTDRNNVADFYQQINNTDFTKRYLLSCYVKTDELDVAYDGGGVKLRVEYKDADGNACNISSVALKTTTEWTLLKLYFQVPEGSKDIVARFRIDCVKGNVLFDKVTIEAVGNAIVSQVGAFSNGGFEEYYDGEFIQWSFYKGGNDKNSVSRDTGRNGYAAVLTDTNTDHIPTFGQTVEIDPEKNYRISVYVKATSTDTQDFYVPSWGGAYLRITAGDKVFESEKITSTGRFKRLSVIVNGSDVPSGVSKIRVEFVMKYLRGVFYLDDAVIAEYNGEPDEPEVLEDLYNLSFEYGKDNTFEDWNKNIPNSKVTIEQTADANDGKRAAVIVSTHRDNVAGIVQKINNTDFSKRYLLSCYYKTDALDVAYDGGGVKLKVSYKDVNGNKAGVASAGMRSASEWTQLKLYFQIPEGASDITAELMIDCVKGNVIFDNVSLTPAGNAVKREIGKFANGGFEEFYDGEFSEWKFSNGSNSKNSVTSDIGRTGNAAVLTDTNTDHILSFSQSVELDRTKNYRIVFYVRATSNDNADFYVPSWGGAFVQLKAGTVELTSEKITAPTRYRKLALIVNGSDLPENTSTVNISFVMKYMRGVIYLDDAVITEYNGEPLEPDVFEDLYNLSFEEGKGDSFDDWNKSVPNSKVTITASKDSYDGKRSVLFDSTDRNNVASVYQSLNNVDPAFRYRITAYAKTLSEPDVAYDGGGIKIRVSYKDKNGISQNSSSAGKRELSEWTRLYVDYQIPEGATDVKFTLMIDCLKGKVVFDKVHIEKIGKAVVMPVQEKENLAPNFSFENGQDGSFPGWYWWTNSKKNGSCLAGEARTGAQAAKLVNAAADCSNQLSWDTTILDTTKYYQFTVWAKLTDVKTLVEGKGGVGISIQFKKKGSNDSLKVYSSARLEGTTDWVKLTAMGKFPKDCERVVFGMSLSQASGSVCFDDVDIRIIDYVDKNVLRNGGFDQVDEDGNLLFWEKETDDWAYASFGRDIGTASVTNSGFCTSYYYQELENLDYMQNYVLSGSIRSNYLVSKDGGAAVMVEFIDVYGNTVKTELCSAYLTDTSNDWQSFACLLEFPENCKKLRVLLANKNGVGEAHFTDFSLQTETDYNDDTEISQGGNIKNLNAPVIAPKKVAKASAPKDNSNAVLLVLIIAGAAVFVISALAVVIVIKRRKLKTQ